MSSNHHHLTGKICYNSDKSNENSTLSNMSHGAVQESSRSDARKKYSSNDLEKAVAASRGGASVRELSMKYNIPRATIYANKNNIIGKSREPYSGLTNYSASDLDKALQDCGAGMSVTCSSIKYNIPPTTIYKYLKKNNVKKCPEDLRLKARESYDEAVLKTWPMCAGNINYLASNLQKAVQDCVAGLSYRESSKKYNVPTTTIFRERKRLEETKTKAL